MLTPHQNVYFTCPTFWPKKVSPTFTLEGDDFFLKSFFVGVVLGFRTTQSSPSTLEGDVVRFFIGVSFTTKCFVGAALVFYGGDFVQSIDWKVIFPNEWCEKFFHTFHMKMCTHKTHSGVELLCKCILTS